MVYLEKTRRRLKLFHLAMDVLMFGDIMAYRGGGSNLNRGRGQGSVGSRGNSCWDYAGDRGFNTNFNNFHEEGVRNGALESDDVKVLRVMSMEMLSTLHWLVGRGTIAGPIQRLVGHEKPPYVPTNTMASLDLRDRTIRVMD